MSVRVIGCVAVAMMMSGFAGCPAPVAPGPVAQAPWVELTSPHFTVWTDADPARVHDIIARMERLRIVLMFVAFPHAPPQSHGLAIVVRDDDELRAASTTNQNRPFAGEMHLPLWQPVIVLSASVGDKPHNLSDWMTHETAIAHELTHMISFGVVHHQPRWFAEGMATYFESVGFDPTALKVEVGSSPLGMPVIVERFPINELFTWNKATEHEGRQYTAAWALYLFLINKYPTELQRFGRMIDAAAPEVEDQPELVRQLWAKAFPKLPLSTIDQTLYSWLFSDASHVVTTIAFPHPVVTISERPLGGAEPHAIRALLAYMSQRNLPQVRSEVAAALAIEPTNVIASLMRAGLDKTEISPDDARAIAGAHEDDWRAWLMVASAGGKRSELDAARARACEIAAANPALSPPATLCHAQPEAAPGPASASAPPAP